ncbi:MAG: PmeII family type II restriction endonuclease [Patescibacteria group bacterium]
MAKLNMHEVRTYVSQNIGGFHAARLNSLSKLELKKILTRKNPYLFKAKNVLTSEALVRQLMDAHLSSQEETMFGDFLEGLAIFINGKVYGGAKSAAEGIDLEFTKDKVKYIVAIKSGPNWGNSSQIARMSDNFKKAKKILNTNRSQTNIVAVNGCCYGQDHKPDKGGYLKYCGQEFWEFVSGGADLYTEIIEPLGHQAKEKNEEFQQQYAILINKFTSEFSTEFCSDGVIDWKKIVELNSKKK